ncbi:MAG TPA: hypothetical protein VGN34_30955 [Ktedonobacteraceae bacterium]
MSSQATATRSRNDTLTNEEMERRYGDVIPQSARASRPAASQVKRRSRLPQANQRRSPTGDARAQVPAAGIAGQGEEDELDAGMIRSADIRAETDDLDYDAEVEEEIEALRIPRRRTQSLSQNQPQHFQLSQFHPLLWLVAGMVILVLLYTIIFWIGTFASSVYNRFEYSPVHTSNADLVLQRKLYHITVVNNHGSLLVTMSQEQDGKITAQTVTGPELNAASWGNLDAIVATANNQHGVLTIHLVGAMSYTHLLFARPSMDFQLIPVGTGYNVIILFTQSV